jgi:hypothetical protein
MKPVVCLLVVAFLLLGCKLEALRAISPDPSGLEILYQGSHLVLFTSGRKMKMGCHKKSGVWNTPARKLTEMWVQRTTDPAAIRLDPYTFREQMVALLPQIPEVHGFIQNKAFTYKRLPQEVEALDEHIERVFLIRQERRERPAIEILN